MTLLTTRGVSVRFGGVQALSDVSLDVTAGTITALIGPNGAGKTTLIDAITGFVRYQGRIEFDGDDITRTKPHRLARRGLVRTFQSLELFDDLTVRDNLLIAAQRPSFLTNLKDVLGISADADELARVDAVMDMLRIRDLADARPADVSLGEQKRITVARGLAFRPKLLMLDEPAAGLDSAESRELGRHLRDVVDNSKVTIFLVDHDMGLVLGTSDRIVVLEAGRMLAAGTPEQIRTNPAVVSAYLGTSQHGGEPQSDEPPLVGGPVGER